ncbi:hypothetical protein AURDEDRAFT_164282 [Auricularia subglabra TFB-10046 SS5]|nr:hypothetical protein AURDEDRAFT_164282 [Auricularia subglabra TFB-10046 SS5]
MAESLVLVEDSNKSLVSYFPPNGWDDRHGAGFEMFHGSSYHVTAVAGGYVRFTFNGSYVAYYSDLNSDHDNFRVSVDGASAGTASSYASSWTNGSRLLFSTPLSPGPHVLTITNVKGGAWTGLDYFMYLPATVPRSTSTRAPATPTPTSTSSSTRITRTTTSSTTSTSSFTSAGFLPESSATSTETVSSTAGPETDSALPVAPSLPSESAADSQSVAHSGMSHTILHAIIGAACAVFVICLITALAILVIRRRTRRTERVNLLAQPPPAYSETDLHSPGPSVGFAYYQAYGSSVAESSAASTGTRTGLSSKGGRDRY